MQSNTVIPDENPTRIDHAGFYRRWLSMIDDMEYLQSYVNRVSGTNEEDWVPLWREAGKSYEEKGDKLESEKKFKQARKCFLQARTYYSIGRFPGAVSDVKKGKIDFKVEKTGIIHAAIGKVSFDSKKISENASELIQTINKLKPTSSKGTYLKSITLSSTMGVGLSIDTNNII